MTPDPGPIALSLDSQPLPPGFELSLPPPSFKDAEATRVVAKPTAASGSEPTIWDELNGKPGDPSLAKAPAPAVAVKPTPATEPRKEPAPPPAIGFTPPSDAPKIEPPKEVALAPKPALPADVVEPDQRGKVAEQPAVAPVEVPVAKPTPTHEEMMQTLEAEAAAKRAALDEQARAKDQAIARVENEAQDRVESERVLFHDGLKRILAAGGSTSAAGKEIDELCDKFGRTYGGDLKAQVLGNLSRFHGKISRDNEIRMLRSLGVPEAGILDYLANNLHRSINSRNGPHTPDAVRVSAAKQLLRSKLLSNPAMGVSPPAGPARARQPQAVRGAVSRPAR